MSTKRSAAKSLTDLPSDVLVEILARLPFRTLIVSKSVCKSFRFLTTPNPHFNDLHSCNAAQVLVFQFGGYGSSSFLLRMADPELDYPFTENSDLKPSFHLPRMVRYSVINSCKGLVYLHKRWGDEDGVSMVCNPVTNEYILIPGVDPQIRLNFPYGKMWLGFSPGSNEYKVLRISSNNGNGAAQVFVIGSDSWGHIIDGPQKNLLVWEPTLANGLMYWHDEMWTHLVSFDFERDKFGEVALPSEFKKYKVRNGCRTSIGVLGGCLCVSCNVSWDHRVYLWVMRNQNSWTKEFVFDTVSPVLGEFKPLQLLRNGQVLMLFVQWNKNEVVCYDPKTETLRYLGLHKRLRLDVNVKLMAMTPSLVPLKDTLKVDKVMLIQQYVRPRGDENELSKAEGDFGTTNLFSRNRPKKIQNMMRGVLDCLCCVNQKQLVHHQ